MVEIEAGRRRDQEGIALASRTFKVALKDHEALTRREVRTNWGVEGGESYRRIAPHHIWRAALPPAARPSSCSTQFPADCDTPSARPGSGE